MYNNYLPRPVASMSPAAAALQTQPRRRDRGAASVPAAAGAGGSGRGFYGPGSRPLPMSYYHRRDNAARPSYARPVAAVAPGPRQSQAAWQPRGGGIATGASPPSERDAGTRRDGSHALWHNRRGSVQMMTQEQILASVAADMNAPSHRSGGRSAASAATWIQSHAKSRPRGTVCRLGFKGHGPAHARNVAA